MKTLLTILFCLSLPLVGAVKKPLTKEESAKIIETAIRQAAKKPAGELTKADFEKVKVLVLVNIKLTDLKGLEKLTKLTWLYLGRNKLTDLKGLEKLTKLTWLNLSNNPDLTKAQIDRLQKALPKCEIFSTAPLTKEESAKVIEAAIRKAAKKPIGELTEADLEKVTYLNLNDNQLADLKGLEKLTQLSRLDLQLNLLTKVPKELENLTQLKWLLLNANQLTSVKGLEKLTQLEVLALGENQLTDVTGLEKLTQLKSLYLGLNQLTDLKGLEKLTKLEVLDLGNNPDLTKDQIAELQKALPKCAF